jgi:type I restriction enzyme S subunit
MGAIKRLKNYDKGVVSTLYICFKTKDSAYVGFYEHYFDAGLINKELHKIAQEGARNHGLLNMSVLEFFQDVHLPLPAIEEQKAIAKFLNSIDEKISLFEKQLEETEVFKKGLLQKMFV